MKETKKMMITFAALGQLTSLASTHACDSHAGFFEGELGQDTQAINIYEDIDAMMFSAKNKFNFGNPFGGNGGQGGRDPFIGLPMRYPVISHMSAEQQMAKAIYHNGQPIVVYGPMAARRLGANIMGFVMQHEYAHHDHRHMTSTPMNEKVADCQATKVLVQKGYQHIVQEVIQFWAREGCHYNPNTPLYMVRQSHPCGTQRAQYISQCAQEAAMAGSGSRRARYDFEDDFGSDDNYYDDYNSSEDGRDLYGDYDDGYRSRRYSDEDNFFIVRD